MIKPFRLLFFRPSSPRSDVPLVRELVGFPFRCCLCQCFQFWCSVRRFYWRVCRLSLPLKLGKVLVKEVVAQTSLRINSSISGGGENSSALHNLLSNVFLSSLLISHVSLLLHLLFAIEAHILFFMSCRFLSSSRDSKESRRSCHRIQRQSATFPFCFFTSDTSDPRVSSSSSLPHRFFLSPSHATSREKSHSLMETGSLACGSREEREMDACLCVPTNVLVKIPSSSYAHSHRAKRERERETHSFLQI